jgi:hypothetical protein
MYRGVEGLLGEPDEAVLDIVTVFMCDCLGM